MPPMPPNLSTDCATSSNLSTSTADEMLTPLSIMDAMMSKLSVVVIYVFPPAATDTHDLKKLHQSFITLVEEDYPILIGELFIDPNGFVSVKQAPKQKADGIRFEVNPKSALTTEIAVESLSWDLLPTPRNPTETITMKGTLLSDGGLAIGLDVSHSLLDGEGSFTLMTAWGQHYSGVNMENRLVINYHRHLLQGTGSPAKFPHPEFQVVNVEPPRESQVPTAPPPTTQHRFHFTPAMLKKLKTVATSGEVYVSTIDSITALFTVLISQARGHGEDVKITTAVNARRRLDPPLPSHYAGNAVFSALSAHSKESLEGGNLAIISRGIRASIDQCNDQYLRDAMDFLASQSNLSAILPATNFFFGPDVMFTSWVNTGMYDAEFAGVKPQIVSVPSLPFDGFVIITEAPINAGGLDILVFLESTAMERLKELFTKVSVLHTDL